MPLFNEASRIYAPGEVDLMRRCFTEASEKLEAGGNAYSASDLASSIISLYQSGLRNQTYIADLAAGIASARYLSRQQEVDVNRQDQ
ncbi:MULTISPECIES: hypothetical protein [Brucella/Ochrobactrum group]|uniref:Uncharacterized protein n=1 Tax=Ochrobactrum soli TaxID=2448455 RepID=A0A2P9HFJ9_9HYPH|nr:MULTISPECIES: hypothetical protein [Brucella]MCI1001763.1 hypothetical protein [Ochrobactrum sp. C6C9]RRD26998.1 hypothetical protein ECB98_05425 [Brucellaceae bacterium VT-16-1752]WHT43472.1 hypothetical protein QLQ11_16385 [Ochrobactrum sp. SSR]MDX4075085.1 hypothetical protein [Brucella sp. NBRC 113783]RLL64599.1 hypothetical protein D8666_22595 [[Ochrobactrum] soli]